MLTIKAESVGSHSLVDLLNWAAAVAPGVVLTKDGGLLAGYYFACDDLMVASPAMRNVTAMRVKDSFSQFDSTWSIHIDSTRVPSKSYTSSETFPDDVSRMIDDERRQRYKAAGQSFESIHSILLKWQLPSSLSRRGVSSLIGRNEEGDDPFRFVDEFENALGEFEDRLSGTLDLDRIAQYQYELDGTQQRIDRLVSHLRWMLTGEAYQIHTPLAPMYLDALLGVDELYAGLVPQLGDKYIQAVSVDGFPLETYPGMLAVLDHLPIQYRWSTRYLFRDQLESQRDLKIVRNKWAEQTRSFLDRMLNRQPTGSSVINQDAVEMMTETETAMSLAASGLVNYGYYSSVIVLMSTDRQEVQTQAREIRKVLLRLGFNGRIEKLNTMEAWMGTLPGHTHENVRRPLLDTMHLANLLPISTPWTGAANCPSPLIENGKGQPLIFAHTEGTTPFRLNLHVDDVGHTLVFGPTGSGKSTLLALICTQFLRYRDACVHIFDKGRSLEVLSLAVGGSHFTIAEPDEPLELCFAPLGLIEHPVEMDWACSWIETLVELQKVKLHSDQRRELRRALQSLANSRSQKTLSALQIAVQDTAMKKALHPYTIAGAYGRLLDSEKEDLDNTTWCCYELANLLEQSEQIALPVLLYLFHHIERQARGNPMLICLDEAWVMLGHTVFREKIREWLKTLRKLNVAVVMATQSISDAVNSGILDVLTESCFTRIFGSNSEAVSVAADAYRNFGLTDPELEVLAELRPKRDYYVIQKGSGRRVVNFDMSDLELAFCGVSSKEDLATVHRLQASHPEDWVQKWVTERVSME